MDVLSMLEHDHRHVETMLSSLGDTEAGAERTARVADVTAALELHMRFEEEHIYPLLADVDAESEEEAEVEHGLAREGLAKLHELLEQPGFGAAVEMLTAGIAHHVRDEEGEAFPELRRSTDEQRLASLARTLLETKRTAGMLVTDHSTKAELADMAGQLGIEHRSSMTKDELEDAIEARP